MTVRTRSTSPIWRWAGFVAAAVIVALIVRQLARGWPAVRAYPWEWHVPYMVASLLVMQLGYLTMARAWRSILRAIDIRLRYTTAYWIFYISNLGRYLPGKFWQIGAAAVFGRSLGLSGSDMAASMILHLLYFLPVGTAMALSSGALPTPFDSTQFQIFAWGLSAAMALAALWPDRLLRVAGPIARRLGVDPRRWRLAFHRRVAVVAQTAFAWFCLSVSFALFVQALTPLGFGRSDELARIYIVSHIAGYVALIAPGGLGVREGVVTLLLTPSIGAGPAAGIALLSRMWVTLTELVAIVPAFYWARRDRRAQQQDVLE